MNTWLFQGNPDTFDLDAYLTRTRQALWTVGQKHLAPRMQVSDRVFLWRASGRSGTPAGIVASGWLVEPPKEQPEDPSSTGLWKGGEQNGSALRVRLDIDRVATRKEIIQADWLKDDPLCKGLRILRFRSETNYLLQPAEAARLEALWKNTGRDWTRQESIAGLWAYHQTYGQPVSRSAGGPVALVAERIGRAVTGVYNKVMNFRAIDPRDTRAGLAAGGQVDRSVWDEFYNPGTQTIRSAELEDAFATLWPEGVDPSIDLLSLKEAVSTAAGRRGQGFLADPAVRKAVELRAMHLAQEHYARLFPQVIDTSASQPFDLRCLDGNGAEVRVEVKGGTGDLEDIRVTAGEVDNARGAGWRTDLFLVSSIVVTPTPFGHEASGGQPKVVVGWLPHPDDLKPLVFACRVP